MEKNRSFGQYVRTAITAILGIGVAILVIVAIWLNTTIPERIYLFLIAVILGLVIYIFRKK